MGMGNFPRVKTNSLEGQNPGENSTGMKTESLPNSRHVVGHEFFAADDEKGTDDTTEHTEDSSVNADEKDDEKSRRCRTS